MSPKSYKPVPDDLPISKAKNQKQKQVDSRIIVDQNQRITKLKDSLEYYKDITETVREPFIILDKDLRVVSANSAFYRKFKVLKKDTISKRIYDLGNQQWDAPELKVLLEHILPKNRVLKNYAVTHDFPTVGRKTILLNARQVDSKQLILLAMEDVTDQWSLKADSEELTANLIEQRDLLQNLIDAKEEFISLASHQLRTPATVVKQYVGMLKDSYVGKLTKDQKNMLGIVDKSNDRQLEIIEDLLRVAKVDAGKVYLKKSRTDVVKLVQTVIKSQAVLFGGRGQSVVLHKSALKIVAFIDAKLVLMVLENLLDNAGKYSPRGEQVSIHVRQTNAHTTIAIKDNGVGIRAEDRRKLFKKFSRIDNPMSASEHGTGLGLYWAKKILDLHNGSLEVVSKLGRGSTFTVKLPIVMTRKNSITLKLTSAI